MKHFKRRKTNVLDGMPDAMDSELRSVVECLMRFLDDPIFAQKRKTLGRPQDEALGADEKGRIFKISPIISGLALFHFRARLHKIGLEMINETGATTICAHLSNAAFEEGYFVPHPDIQFAINYLGENSFFVGALPTKRQDYLKRFLMQYGFPAVTFTGHGRRGAKEKRMMYDFVRHRNQRCIIKANTPISSIFVDRYVEPQRTLARPQEMVKPEKGKAGSSSESSEEEQAKPTALLMSLVFWLHAEAMDMAFPYFALESACWVVLRGVNEICAPHMMDIFDKSPRENYKQTWAGMAEMVGDILLAAQENEPRGETLFRLLGRVLAIRLIKTTPTPLFMEMMDVVPLFRRENVQRLAGGGARQPAEQGEDTEGDGHAGKG
ncbi:hypothetical protein NCS52_00797400 [Fusarium sp. LHS14.1]|nr:hypothetical protein NCS52_00797400 [Fusarium sp. LHS14.1]